MFKFSKNNRSKKSSSRKRSANRLRTIEKLEERQFMAGDFGAQLAHVAPPVSQTEIVAQVAPAVLHVTPLASVKDAGVNGAQVALTSTPFPVSPPDATLASVRSVTANGMQQDFGLDASTSKLVIRNRLSNGWLRLEDSPALTSFSVENVGGSIKVFGLTQDGKLHVKSFQSNTQGLFSQSNWLEFNFGGSVSSYRVDTTIYGRMQVFAIKTDGNLVTSIQTTSSSAGFNGHQTFEAYAGFYTDVQLARRPDGKLAVFALDKSGVMRIAVQTSKIENTFAWAGTFNSPVAGVSIRSIAAGRGIDGRMEVFAVGSNSRLYQATEQSPSTGHFPGWRDINMSATSVAVGKNADGRLQVFAVDPNGFVSFRTQTSSGTWPSTSVTFNKPQGLPFVKVETRHENGRIVVRASTADPYWNGIWETRQSAINRSESGWPSWVRLTAKPPR